MAWNQEPFFIKLLKIDSLLTLVNGIFENEFCNLLNLTDKGTFFTFNIKIYIQVDGVSTGSLLGPILAKISLLHNKKTGFVNDLYVLVGLQRRKVSKFQKLLKVYPFLRRGCKTKFQGCFHNIKFMFDKMAKLNLYLEKFSILFPNRIFFKMPKYDNVLCIYKILDNDFIL